MVQQLEAKTQTLSCVNLPLAIYREVVAHLHQVDGVKAELIPQQSQEFDYLQSQIAGLWLDCTGETVNLGRVEAILAHYAQRYGEWEALSPLGQDQG